MILGLVETRALALGIFANCVAAAWLEFAANSTHEHRQLSASHIFGWGHLLLFVLRPLRDSFDALPTSFASQAVTPEQLNTGLLVGAIGAVGIGLGMFLVAHRRRDSLVAERGEPRTSPPRDGLVVISAVVLAYVTFAYGRFVSQAGGLSVALGGRSQQLDAALRQSNGFLYNSPTCLTGLGLVWIAASNSKHRRALGYAFILMGQVPAIFEGNRSALLLAIIAASVVERTRRADGERRPSRTRSAVTAFLVLASLGLFGVLRDARSSDSGLGAADWVRETATAYPRQVDGLLTSLDTAMYHALSVEVSRVPSSLDYRGPAVYGAVLVQVVPSGFFSSKPAVADTYLTGRLFSDAVGEQTGLSFSFVGEPYLAGGIPLVFALGGLFGAALAAIDRMTNLRRGIRIVPSAILIALVPAVTRGGLGANWLQALIALAPYGLVILFVHLTEGSRRTLQVDQSQLQRYAPRVDEGGN